MKCPPFSLVLLAILMMAAVPRMHAAVTLPAVLGDNMVIQRNRPTTLWGWADQGEKVTVSMEGKVVATAEGKGADSFWKVRLPALKAGKVPDITVSGATNSITLTNLLAGELWLCGGQSNMVMTISKVRSPWCWYGGVKDADKEIAEATHPGIRFFTEEKGKGEPVPSLTSKGKWLVCSPETAGVCSATGYFFARTLQETLRVPVGLVISAIGGTAVEPWTPAKALEGDPGYASLTEAARKTKATLGPAAAADAKLRADWSKAVQQAKAAKQPIPPAPVTQLTQQQRDALADAGTALNTRGFGPLYNAKIHPLTPLTIGGALWYQGESNGNLPANYRYYLGRMIEGWRSAFGQQFPFLIVQLAKCKRGGSWEQIREAQDRVARELPACGIATAIDIGEPGNIHPLNKQEVGRRLALVALNQVYGREIVASGPRFAAASFGNGKAVVTFAKGTAEGLALSGPGGFLIAGEDRKFVPATAVVKDGALEVSAPGVARPVAVRYAFETCPETPLVNAQGLGAFPFRSDDWEIVTAAPVPAPVSKPASSPAATSVSPSPRPSPSN